MHGAASRASFDRGHLDHLAIDVGDTETFQLLRSRLVEEGATDGTLTDFGTVRSVWFEDPDGMGGEITMWSSGTPRTFDDRTQDAYAAVRQAAAVSTS